MDFSSILECMHYALLKMIEKFNNENKLDLTFFNSSNGFDLLVNVTNLKSIVQLFLSDEYIKFSKEYCENNETSESNYIHLHFPDKSSFIIVLPIKNTTHSITRLDIDTIYIARIMVECIDESWLLRNENIKFKC